MKENQKGESMESEVLLSIILPVFRVEKYIRECLNSILPQLNDKTQLIIVDDCGLDASIKICEDMTKEWMNVTIKNREKNGGLSAARNTGLEEATGKYVWFIDSDDYIANDAIEDLFHYMTEDDYDVIQFNHFRFGGGNTEVG